jgi:hypothetical protein
MKRRIFNALGITGLLSTFIPSNQDTITKSKKMKDNFVHHVYFWLKNPGSAEDKAKLIEGLKTLTKVKSLKSHHIGVPANTNRDVIDSSYSISWLTIFDNAKGQDAYQTDPIHLAFVDNYKHIWSKVIVYDSVNI